MTLTSRASRAGRAEHGRVDHPGGDDVDPDLPLRLAVDAEVIPMPPSMFCAENH
jgi:hypothetical protein